MVTVSDQLINILPPIVKNHTKVIILGSMPSSISLEKQEYYGNIRNQFWSIMSKILEVEIPDLYEEKIALLHQNSIGLWDSIKSCERQGSLDATIKNEIPNDFSEFFISYPSIRAIFFNGAKAEQVFKKYYPFIHFPHIHFQKMPSTSPIPGKNIKTLDGKIVCWRDILSYI